MSDITTPATPAAPAYTVPLYQAIAQKLQAVANCERSWQASRNGADVDRWHDMAQSHRDAATALVSEHMPHGSGIDSGVTLNSDSDERRLIFDLSFHYMDGNGCYCGWVDYTATVEPSLTSAFDLGLIEDEPALRAIQYDYRMTLTCDCDDDGRGPDSAADYIHDVLSDALSAQVDPYSRATRALAAAAAPG